jgi:hypothetical protein
MTSHTGYDARYRDTGLLLLTMVFLVLFIASTSVPTTATILTSLSKELSLPSHHFPTNICGSWTRGFPYVKFCTVCSSNNRRVNVVLNYKVNDPSIINSQINSVMKVYWPNRTLFKTSFSPEGFILNESGTQRHATTITNNKLVDPTAVVSYLTF